MAQMPKGKPRSVPDPAGEQYDAMMRQERLKQQRADQPAAWPPISLKDAAPFDDRLDFLRQPQPPKSTVRIGSQDYREVDTGRGGVLVPADDPLHSPDELAEQRRGIERAMFMADHPLGSVAYDVATVASASPRLRDAFLVGGGVADAAMFGAAPRGASVRSSLIGPRIQSAPPPLPRDLIRPTDPSEEGQAMGVYATITPPMLKTGTKADRGLQPPGWLGNGTVFNQGRGHLLASQLGGEGDRMRNIVTLTQNPTNSSWMKTFENGVAKRVRAGEVMEYSSIPLYTNGVPAPSAILMTAYGSRGAPIGRVVENPAGRRR